ncbi:S8 family serine peptidase [Modestobacter sp. VKM Ac-2985]|uniref:S8 family serine peptidase n=1 Tax=Modestobacter sp. VKM Ac-2985 TaxID=3004139 RepID=UPI0022AB7FD2|nr:S8 family serine peptidase [Modestobacter sp. VKM Ac-2985]MCZ2838168.1 S8 family serine peptidase [Modestobacter sp. VKM Ac-2985]
MDLVGHQGSRLPAHRRGVRVVAVVAAALTGFGGAAAVDALVGPPLPVAEGFGPGDGLTRYVVTAAAGDATPEFLAGLDQQDGVDSAQRLSDGTALVAVDRTALPRLRSLPGIAAVEVSPSVPVSGTASDPYYAPYAWHLENTGDNAYGQSPVQPDADIDGSAGWDASTGAGIVVAVVDTGFDSDHPDLAGSLWTNPAEPCGSADVDGNGLAGDCHGWNFATNSPDVDNGAGGGHGTSVAGVIGARKDNGAGSVGVAPDVTLMPLVIGTGGDVDVHLGAEAIRYAADHGAAVVNASWGGPVTGSALDNLRAAVAYAEARGVLVAAAAGNDAADRDTSLVYPASLTEPNVVTVGNSTAADTVAASSAYGATSVDLFAPGEFVVTTAHDGGYQLVSGTSIAAPQVAAALALYRATLPTATVAELRTALLADVDPIAAFTGKSVTGGRLNVSRLDPGAASVGYQFTSTTAPTGPATPRVRMTGPELAGTYELVLGLGMEHGGEVWALSGEPVTVAGTTLTTDDAGQVTVPLGTLTTVEGVELAPSADLAPGRYALSAQLLVDGQPFGGTFAAPLLVGATSTPAPAPDGGTTPGTDPGTTDPGTTDPGTTDPGTTDPGTTEPGTPDPGTSEPGPTDPGTTDPGTSEPGTSDPGTTDPGTTDPGTTDPETTDPGTTDPETTDPGTPDPETTDPDTTEPGTTDPGTTDPGTPDPGTTDPGTPGPDTTDPGTTDPGTTDPAPDGSTPPPVVTYPEVGPFGLTSISPSVVSTAGGTRVTVTGTDVPDGARVRIGDTRVAIVVSADSTSVVFTAPELVAGVYDVFVFGPTGTESSVLADGLTYVAEPTGGGGTDPAPDAGDGTAPDAGSTPDTGGGSSVVTAVGPDGERLVRSATFGRLGSSFWSLDCSSSCRGVLL